MPFCFYTQFNTLKDHTIQITDITDLDRKIRPAVCLLHARLVTVPSSYRPSVLPSTIATANTDTGDSSVPPTFFATMDQLVNPHLVVIAWRSTLRPFPCRVPSPLRYRSFSTSFLNSRPFWCDRGWVTLDLHKVYKYFYGY